jgi:hypothetical protein
VGNPFRYFNGSPEIIRPAVLMYVKYPLSPRNVEDRLFERGIDISHEAVRYWWNRFGPIFAAGIRKGQVAHMRGYPQWRWHSDEVFVKVDVRLCYLWRPVDHECEVLETVVAAKRDKGPAQKFFEANHEETWLPQEHRDRRALLFCRGIERGRHRRPARGWPSAQQSGGEFPSTLLMARAGHAAISKREDPSDIQFNSRPGPQPFQSGAPSRRSRRLAFHTGRIDRPIFAKGSEAVHGACARHGAVQEVNMEGGSGFRLLKMPVQRLGRWLE